MSPTSTSALAPDSPLPGAFWLRFWARLDIWTLGMRGPALAAALVFVSALLGLIALPPLDRDESRFAEATAQMLATGDFIDIRYQGEARDKKPVGIHWLQAASVTALSSVEERRIWAYRIPSLIGAMTAAAACAWGANAFFGSRASFFAGAILGTSFLLSSEAFIAKTDAVLCGATVVSMAALGRIYGAYRSGKATGAGVRALFWSGQAVAILDKGPVGPMVAALAIVSLAIADRDAKWVKSLGWGWGFTLVALICGPWALAITTTTDGGFWTGAVVGDMVPKLAGGHETHGAPPGLHALLLPFMIFPSTFLLPAVMIAGWQGRAQPGVRFALAWLVPAWIVFELLPTKLVHYPLPTYGALGWLGAAALADPAKLALGPRARWIGAGLSVVVGLLFAAAIGVLLTKYGSPTDAPWAAVAALLAFAAGLAGAWALLKKEVEAGLILCLTLGVLTHMVLAGGLAPRLNAIWSSQRVADRLAKDHLDPRNGVTPGPVAVTGYAEPSLVFTLGAGTELDDPADAADAVADGQPAIVEKRQDQAFRAALAAQKIPADPVDEVKGFDYSIGKPVDLTIWRSLAQQPASGKAP